MTCKINNLILVVVGVGRKRSWFEKPVDARGTLNVVPEDQIVDVDVRIEIESEPRHELKSWALA